MKHSLEITLEKLLQTKAPFKVVQKGRKQPHVITGFLENDPLGVGGGLLPNMPCVVFKGGGWLLLQDLIKHYRFSE